MKKEPHLLIISYYFPPVKVVGAIRLYHFYRESRKYFHNVEVLTTSNRQLMEEDDSLRLEEASLTEVRAWDLRRLSLKRDRRSAPHLSQGAKSSRLSRFLRRLLDSFPFNILIGDGGLVYILAGYRQGKRLVKEQGITHLFSSFRPYSDHIIAYLLKRRFPELYWVADFRDLHVDSVRRNTICPHFQRFCNRNILRQADLITTVSEGLKEQLNVLASNVFVLRNGIGPELANQGPLPLFDTFTIAYTGSLYPGLQTAGPLFQAIRQLLERNELTRDVIKLVYAGKDGALWEQWLQEFGLTEIGISRKHLPLKEAREIQGRAHINLLLSWNFKSNDGILSSKVYEYLAAHRPILGIINGKMDEELERLLPYSQCLTIATQEADVADKTKEFIERVKKETIPIEKVDIGTYTWDSLFGAFFSQIQSKNPCGTK